MVIRFRRTATIIGLALLWGGEAVAYIGPGAGVTVIGTVIAVVGAVLLMIVGFIYYPIKRLLRARRHNSAAKSDSANVAETAGE